MPTITCKVHNPHCRQPHVHTSQPVIANSGFDVSGFTTFGYRWWREECHLWPTRRASIAVITLWEVVKTFPMLQSNHTHTHTYIDLICASFLSGFIVVLCLHPDLSSAGRQARGLLASSGMCRWRRTARQWLAMKRASKWASIARFAFRS